MGRDDSGPAFGPLSVLETEADVAWPGDLIATCFKLQTGRALSRMSAKPFTEP